MILISRYNIIYLILLHVFVQLIESAPDPLDEVIINVNIGGSEQGVKCGVKKKGTESNSRIYGGNETEVNEYPWIALLALNKWGGFCGGSVIADKWILTAAHCFHKRELGSFDVVLGEHMISNETESNITKRVKPNLMILHPKFNYGSGIGSGYDVALLRIPPIDLRTYTPVCLPTQGVDYTGKNAWTYGWGANDEDLSSGVLLDVKVPVVSDAEAYAKFAAGDEPHGPRYLTDEELEVMIFAGEVGRDTCGGDSGGPLTYANPDNDGRHEQIGITSWGWACGDIWPGVFTEVTTFMPWILNEMDKNG